MKKTINVKMIIFTISVIICSSLKTSIAQDTVKIVHPIDEVVVTATKTARILKNIPVETNLISRKEIENSGAMTASDAIRWVPGLNISGGAPFGSARRFTGIIRGLPAQYSLVLVDGKRIKGEHIHTGVNLGILPIELIEKVEIIKGPSCALYGSDAMGGVINIISKPISAKPSLNASAAYSTFNTKDISISHGQKVGKLGYFLGYKYTGTDGTSAHDTLPTNWFNQNNVMLKLTYDINESNYIGLNGKYYHINYLRNAKSEDDPDHNDNEIDLMLDWKSKVSEKSNLVAELAYAQFTGSRKDAENITQSANIMFESGALKNQFIIIGLEGRMESFTRTGVDTVKEESIYGAYLQDEIKILDNLSAIASIRADFHPNIDPVIAPNAAILYKPFKNTDLRLSYGRGFRAASLQDRYEEHFKHGSYYRNGNQELNPEYSNAYSIGIEQRIVKGLSARVAAFRNDFTDMIYVNYDNVLDTVDGLEVFQRENMSSATIQGIETEFRYTYGGLNAMIGYTYLDTEDDQGRVLSYNPEHLISARLYYNIERLKLNAMVSVEDSRGRYYKNNSSEVKQLEDYTLVNINFNKHFGKHINLFVTLGNIFNTEFSVYEEGKTWSSYGRTYQLGAKFKL